MFSASEGSSLLSYEKLSLDSVERKILRLVAACRRYDGYFVLLWQNSMLIERAAREAYSRIARAAVGVDYFQFASGS